MSARAPVPCKENYAASVKEIMPHEPGPAGRDTVILSYIRQIFRSISHPCLKLGLTGEDICSIIIFTHAVSYAQETEPRPQNPGLAATGLLKLPSRAGHRRTVRIKP